MKLEYTALLFLRMSLANAYDQEDEALVNDLCAQIDALTLDKARQALKTMEESAG